MIATRLLSDAMLELIAADPLTLAPAADANHLHLVTAPFTPGPDLTLAALTFATFTGSTPKNVGLGAQPVYTDPVTGFRYIKILEPAGGWSWVNTVLIEPGETVYGVAMTDNDNLLLFGAQTLPEPVLISQVDDAVEVGSVRFTNAGILLT